MNQPQSVGRIDLESPAEIYLMIDPDGDPDDRGRPFPVDQYQEWCAESVGGLEVRYVRADLVATMKKADER